jgi:subtilisin family serine protease
MPPIYRLPPPRVEAVYTALSETIDWGLRLLDVPPLWRQSRGQGVCVAVLDTGIDADHPDLIEAIDDARDFTASRHGPADRQGHGTHVAGIVAARQNERGVVGVAPACGLLAAKVLDDDGAGGEAAVVAGIDWAVAAGADVLSMSFGGPRPSVPIYRAIQRAVDRGRFVVCAAGNAGRPDSVDYPARLPMTVAVGAVDRAGRAARFYSRGTEVDVCAPGQEITSCWLDAGYAKLSGTSMAAPFVSGVVALLLAKHRRMGGKTPVSNQDDLIEHLRRTARDAGPAGRDPAHGWGLIDPAAVLGPEADPMDDPVPSDPTPMPTRPPAGGTATGVWVWIPGGRVA